MQEQHLIISKIIIMCSISNGARLQADAGLALECAMTNIALNISTYLGDIEKHLYPT